MVKRTIIVLIALAMFVHPAAAGTFATGMSSQASSDVTLTLSVVNSEGNGIGGTAVTASWDSGETTATTAGNGKTFIDVPAGAEIEITIDHDDYVRNNAYVIDSAEEDTYEVDAFRKSSAAVTVVDGDGDAVEGAMVRFWKNGELATQESTDNSGAVYSGTIERGDYTIIAVKSGYYRQSNEVMVQGDVSRELEIERGSVTVDFTVRDNNYDSPQPVENAEVAVDGVGTIQTNSDGENGLRVPVNTDVSVTVNKEGYDERTTEISVEEETMEKQFTIKRTPTLVVDDINEKIVAGQTVSVEVVDEYGEPVDGATVYVDDSSVGETDADGELSATVDGEGDHELYVEKDGLQSDTNSFEAISSDSNEAEEIENNGDDSRELPEELAGMPGFGPVVALAGVLIGVALLARRS